MGCRTAHRALQAARGIHILALPSIDDTRSGPTREWHTHNTKQGKQDEQGKQDKYGKQVTETLHHEAKTYRTES